MEGWRGAQESIQRRTDQFVLKGGYDWWSCIATNRISSVGSEREVIEGIVQDIAALQNLSH